jgi:hypothetical protein
MSIVSSHHGVVVSQNADGSYSWSGQYNGAPIKRAVPSEDGNYCILLLDPDANNGRSFENLLCVDRTGNPVWTAKLPETQDVFVDIALTREGLQAWTWSCFMILLDRSTGAELKRVFTK